MTRKNALAALSSTLAAAAILASAQSASAQYYGPPRPAHPGYGAPFFGADSDRPHWYFGVEATGYFIMKQVTDNAGFMGQGGGGGLHFGYRVGPYISLEFNLDISYHNEAMPEGTIFLNSLFLLAPTADIKIHLSKTSRLQPFFQAGIGYGYLGATYAEGAAFCSNISCDTTFAQGPLFEIGGGFDFWFMPRLSFGARLLYRAIYLSTSIDQSSGSASISNNFINGLKLGLNLSFHYY